MWKVDQAETYECTADSTDSSCRRYTCHEGEEWLARHTPCRNTSLRTYHNSADVSNPNQHPYTTVAISQGETYIIEVSTGRHLAVIIVDGNGLNRCRIHDEKNVGYEKKKGLGEMRNHSIDQWVKEMVSCLLMSEEVNQW